MGKDRLKMCLPQSCFLSAKTKGEQVKFVAPSKSHCTLLAGLIKYDHSVWSGFDFNSLLSTNGEKAQKQQIKKKDERGKRKEKKTMKKE